MRLPSVLVSSTFYDLRFVRAELDKFLRSELGYNALLSELATFPIDPDSDTITNCRKQVEDNADILVLLIGGRYGSIDSRVDNSITNLEYLEARRKGIPIYAFVEKRILSFMEIWKQNQTADYSSVVDTPRLFDFVEMIRTIDMVWTFPFETGTDITSTLRLQFAYLLYDGLETRSILKGSGLPAWLKALGPSSLKIALEKPKGWEYLLFAQSWLDETEKREDEWFAFKSGIVTGSAESVPAERALEWCQKCMQELLKYNESANFLVNTAAAEAFGAPGQPGDAESIVRVTKKLGEVYEAFLSWTSRVRGAYIEEPFVEVIKEMRKFPDATIASMREFPRTSYAALKETIEKATPEKPQQLNLTLTFNLSNLEAYEAAMAKVKRKIGVKS